LKIILRKTDGKGDIRDYKGKLRRRKRRLVREQFEINLIIIRKVLSLGYRALYL
jgi:hypothetical protein